MKRIYVTLVFVAVVCCQMTAQNGDQILSADSLITMDGCLDSLYRSLPEVMVVGERPVVKAMQGKLVYDLPRLLKNVAVDNAYDGFSQRLLARFPLLTLKDIYFCCLVKINVSIKDLSDIYCISRTSVSKKKFRIKREKLGAEDSDSLDDFLRGF